MRRGDQHPPAPHRHGGLWAERDGGHRRTVQGQPRSAQGMGCERVVLSMSVGYNNEHILLIVFSGEVDLVELHIICLTEAGLKPQDIAVIAPYNLQVRIVLFKMIPKYYYWLISRKC